MTRGWGGGGGMGWLIQMAVVGFEGWSIGGAGTVVGEEL